jgi:hypothetical protein
MEISVLVRRPGEKKYHFSEVGGDMSVVEYCRRRSVEMMLANGAGVTQLVDASPVKASGTAFQVRDP